MVDNLISVEHVAEALWHAVEARDLQGPEIRKGWGSLPLREQEGWRKRAEIAIADWKRFTFVLPSRS
jgi:hypothetical protein